MTAQLLSDIQDGIDRLKGQGFKPSFVVMGEHLLDAETKREIRQLGLGIKPMPVTHSTIFVK